MPPLDTDLAARVRAGMAFLDQRLGKGWESAIDVERLDLNDPCGCILGQLGEANLFGTTEKTGDPFWDVLGKLGWRDASAEIAALAFDFSEYAPADKVVYADLTAAWRAQLAARRAEKEGTE